jgi:hypothetical protein
MLQHILGRNSSWAFAMILAVSGAVGCGDDGAADNDGETAGKSGSGAGGKGGASAEMKCNSYQKPEGDQCAGWYCEVTEAQLVSMVDADAKCGGDVPLLCRGTVVEKVGECARRIKSAMPLAESETLRQPVRDCVYETQEIKDKVPQDCLDCTIDAAVCAGDKCIGECLAGNSAGCDKCRLENGCDQMVFSCGGLPSPLKE